MPIQCHRFILIALCTAAALTAGCRTDPRRVARPIGSEVLGAQAPEAVRQAYRTPAFVVRGVENGRHMAIQDTDLPPDARVDDSNLLIFVEGAGDSADGFRATARLLAESPHVFPCDGPGLVVMYLKWCQSGNVVAEHMNHAAQEAGAGLLADMLEVHRVRHCGAGHVAVIGFSAGTRVIEMAFRRAAEGAAEWHPAAFGRTEGVVFVGSSVGSEEAMPFAETIRGRFINFTNPRDTHFGDRAAYVAPAGATADPLKLIFQATWARRPRFGASVAGFRNMPVLTAADQFDALDALAAARAPASALRAFRMVNVPAPETLVAYNLFGLALPDDDFDDYLNLAPNHYILVGRGPGGRTDTVSFKQYRAAAEEFVREHVGAAAMQGRLFRFDLKAATKGANPLGPVPTLVPWAVFAPNEPEAPPPEVAPKSPPNERP